MDGTGSFGRHRKIAPFLPGERSCAARSLARQGRLRSTSMCSAMAPWPKAEWAAAGIAAPDLPAMRALSARAHPR